MPDIHVVDKDVTVNAPPGEQILFALWDNQVSITSICGGNCSCGACNIEVLQGMENINAKTECEQKVLAKIKRQGTNVRLACQCIPTGEVTIRIVPEVRDPDGPVLP